MTQTSLTARTLFTRVYVCTFVLLLSQLHCSAQFEKEHFRWYFGHLAGLNFHTNPVTADSGNMIQAEGCAVANDRKGNLLFYTNGQQVWRRNHIVMDNGSGLGGHTSSTQAVATVKKPGSDSLFYVFTTDAVNGAMGFCYSVVSMLRDSGWGDMVVKKVPILNPAAEKLVIIQKGNGRGYWVVCQEPKSLSFRAYSLDTGSFDTLNYQRSTFPYLYFNLAMGDYAGSLKFSYDGTKAAAAYPGSHQVILFDFDRNTGLFHNPLPIAFSNFVYVVQFSANSRFLYVTEYLPNKILSQVDLWAGDSTRIRSSVKIVQNFGPGGLEGMDMLVGPDGRLYVSRLSYNYISAIPNPDLPAPACGFIDNAVKLSNSYNQYCLYGLPNFPVVEFGKVMHKKYCYSDSTEFRFSFSQIDSVTWNFGDTASGLANISHDSVGMHRFSAPGTYKVWLRYFLQQIDTVFTMVTIYPKPVFELGPDTTICEGQQVKLDSKLTGAQLLWNTGSQAKYINTDTAGLYKAVAYNGCFYSDSVRVTIDTTKFRSALVSDTTICKGDSVKLDTRLSPAFNYQWSNGGQLSYITTTQGGYHYVHVSDKYCHFFDTVFVKTDTLILPPNVLGDTLICKGALARLDTRLPLNFSFLWNNGSTLPYIYTDTAGRYYVTISDGYCNYTDTGLVEVDSQQVQVTLGADTVICRKVPLLLKAQTNMPATFLWQDGSADSVYAAFGSGLYFVVAKALCNIATDSVRINECPCVPVIPNVFTPNADGFNDVFRADSCDLHNYHLHLYNRWGEPVFESNNSAIGWDGTRAGKPMAEGVYFWVLEFENSADKVKRNLAGAVTLLR